MKQFVKNIQDLLSIDNLLKHRKLLVYFVFVGIATVFWLLSALSQNYNTQIKYPVRFVNLPKDKVLVNELPRYLDLNVDGYGFTLLRYKVKQSVVPASIDLERTTLFPLKGKENKHFVLTRYITKQLEEHISDEIDVLYIQPDSIIFDFTKIVTKKVPVSANVSFSTSQQYLITKKPWCQPDSIELSGPKSILDSIQSVTTKHLDLDDLTHNMQRNVGIESIDEVKLSEKRVKVSIEVEKFTEGKLKLPISVMNMPDSLVLKTFPDEITVVYQVALSDFEKVKPYQFKLAVDYNNFHTGGEFNAHKMKVELKSFPSFVHSIKYRPRQVDFIFEKK